MQIDVFVGRLLEQLSHILPIYLTIQGIGECAVIKQAFISRKIASKYLDGNQIQFVLSVAFRSTLAANSKERILGSSESFGAIVYRQFHIDSRFDY